MKIFSPVLKGTTVSDGTSNLSGSFTGSLFGTATTASNANTASYVVSSVTDQTQNTRLQTLESVTGSFALTSSFSAYTASNDALNTTQNARLLSNEQKTGSFATTGSNFFIGNQVITGSVYIANDLIVQGSSSLQNITASAVSVGTNRIILNTATPILQFGGISVQDSGSTMGRSGSLLWNSINDHWINVNPSGSDEGYNSAMVINGPKNTGSLGNEAGLTTNYIPVSQGEDHITDSIIFQSGSNIGISTTTPTEKLSMFGGTATTFGLSLEPSGWNSAKHRFTVPISGDGSILSFNWNGSVRDYASYGSSVISLSQGQVTIGVGSGNPTTALTIASSGAATFVSNVTATQGIFQSTSGNQLRVAYDSSYYWTLSRVAVDGRLAFVDSTNGEKLTVLAGGNVGIGITNPSTKFQVSGDVALGGSLNSAWAVSVDNLGTTGANGLYVNIGASSTGVPFSVYKNFAALFQIANSGVATFSSSITARSLTANSEAVFNGISQGTSYQYADMVNTSGRLILGVDGNAGGQIIPSFSQAYAVSFGTDKNRYLHLFTNNIPRLNIDGSGNVGIGITNPFNKMTIKTGTGNNLDFFDTGASFGLGMQAVNDANTVYKSWDFYASKFQFLNGNMGLKTDPTATLDINGSVRYRGAIHDQFNYVANGNFTNGTYYNIVGVNQIQSGIYVLEGYIDTYAAGAGIYFMRFVSVPFYLHDVGSNSVTFSDFPAVLGTGHHLGNAFPLFRLQQTLAGAGIYLQFNPNASWSGMDNSSGKAFQVNLKRLGS